MFRRAMISALMSSVLLVVGCTNKKVQNPIANVNSKQPDKVLFDRAMDAMKHTKYDVARLSLQTLINTYPDSEYVARAKLAIGDSWYAEGGSAAWTQAESEYKDFETFFPNMPEAAEAQMKIANIHYKEMEKADRDFTHAKRAEEEYRQMILQYPDSKLVPEAKQRLLEVQEVLAEREYMIGHFYFLRESWPAAIARLRSVADTYPLFSGADQALFELGQAYEREIDLLRRSKLTEEQKGALIKKYSSDASEAYSRIVTRYPMEDRVGDAKKRLQALNQPVPTATPQAVEQNKKEIASRGSSGTMGKIMENFRKGPDVSIATKAGEPTLVDPKQASAPELVRAATTSLMGGGNNKATVETVAPGAAAPDANAPVPRSDAPPAAETSPGAITDNTVNNASPTPSANAGGPISGAPASGDTKGEAVPELKNDLAPATNAGSTAATPAASTDSTPAAATTSPAADSGSSSSNVKADSAQTGSTAGATDKQAAPSDPNSESSSKKKKKRHFPF